MIGSQSLRVKRRISSIRIVAGTACRIECAHAGAERQYLAGPPLRPLHRLRRLPPLPRCPRRRAPRLLRKEAPTPAPPQQATGGNVLPETRVVAPVERRQPRTRPPQVVANLPPAPTQAQVVAKQNQAFDAARQNIVTPVGANSYEVSHQAIEALPQGNNAQLDKVLLQMPGVTQDSAASGELHVRNEHANLQYRINGIMLPDGVGAFGQILDTGIVGSLALYRRAAGAIRPAHRRRPRHPDQGGRIQQLRQRQRLWRQPRNHHAEFRIWRHGRANPVFRIRALSPEQSGNRKSDAVE